jgi:HTH-type transcriptional regulator / antitoxin HigA
MLEEKGWTQQDLAAITGHRRQTISTIVSGKGGVTADMAVALSAAFGNPAEDWLRWGAQYELSIASTDSSAILRRARTYAVAPIREMQKRGWIKETEKIEELERELELFFDASLDGQILFPVAARKSVPLATLTPEERAWCFRARQLCKAIQVKAFERERLGALEKRLRQLAAYPTETSKLPKAFSDYGIRFAVVELPANSSIDGAAFWIDEDSPAIAVSVRFDRIDAFWFTVMHEYMHIKNGDAYSVDAKLLNDGGAGIYVALAENEAEQMANEMAADFLVPTAELDSFIHRLAPLFSADRIVQFAHRMKIHPGIIVGQLQHRRQVGYAAHRDFLVRVRAIVTETALTDGWGQTITPNFL